MFFSRAPRPAPSTRVLNRVNGHNKIIASGFDGDHTYHTRHCFFNGTATTELYTLSLPDALPVSVGYHMRFTTLPEETSCRRDRKSTRPPVTSCYLVCRLLLEKKNRNDDGPHVATRMGGRRQEGTMIVRVAERTVAAARSVCRQLRHDNTRDSG